MLARFLYDADGRVRVRRMIAVVATCICLALFGTFFLVLTPALSEHEGIRTVWVLFSVFMLKFPLVALLWWFIARNKEWPVRPPKWSERETKEILDYLVAEADRCRDMPDAPARLAYLRGEAWNVADRVSGDVKVDAVNVALHIDEMTRPRARRSTGP
jgi:hypothetical protein